jgi:hypothetical protein
MYWSLIRRFVQKLGSQITSKVSKLHIEKPQSSVAFFRNDIVAYWWGLDGQKDSHTAQEIKFLLGCDAGSLGEWLRTFLSDHSALTFRVWQSSNSSWAMFRNNQQMHQFLSGLVQYCKCAVWRVSASCVLNTATCNFIFRGAWRYCGYFV